MGIENGDELCKILMIRLYRPFFFASLSCAPATILFLRDYNVSSHAKYVPKDLTQTLRIGTENTREPYPQRKCLSDCPFCRCASDKYKAYAKLTQHACLTTSLRNLTPLRFLFMPIFHMTRPLLSSSLEVSCGAQIFSHGQRRHKENQEQARL